MAQQVAAALGTFSKYKPLKIVAIFGGASINPQIEHLRKADVVVGTPGRILDHIGRGTLSLRKINILVLDEADRMLDMGFIPDVKKIVLARKFLKEPISVSAEAYVDPRKLTQYYYDVPDNLKFSLLVHLLNHEESELVMVFCNTRSNTDFVANNLKALGIGARAIHGGLTQDKRDRTMKQFHSHDVRVLVCTDVAARGLDIPDVSHIYNYDIPMYSKDYIHRIGRTARAGKDGIAISILASRDYDNFRRVMKSNEVTITEEKMPDVKKVRISRKDRPKSFRPRRRPHSS